MVNLGEHVREFTAKIWPPHPAGKGMLIKLNTPCINTSVALVKEEVEVGVKEVEEAEAGH